MQNQPFLKLTEEVQRTCPTDLEPAVAYLRQLGFSKVESIRAIITLFTLPLNEANAAVHESATWADRRAADEAFNDLFWDTLLSSGYESVATEFLARRGAGRSTGVGVDEVRAWARTLPRGAAVIDLGCGPGFPLTETLVIEGLNVFGVDGSRSFVEAFERNLPNTPITCEAVQSSRFFDRTFDGVLAWGLVFLLSAEDQHRLIRRIAEILAPGGCLLFTAPAQTGVWNDAMTGLESHSLGAEAYRRELAAVGLQITCEYEDVGENHYFEVLKPAISTPGKPDYPPTE